MKASGKCLKCGCRRILVIDEFKAQREWRQGEPFYLHLWPPQNVAGRFNLFVCCRCGYAEWHARDFEKIIERLGELYPEVRVVDHDLLDAVKALQLPQDPSATIAGWTFLAHGTYEGVPLAIGERTRARMTESGSRAVMMIEVMSRTRAELGRYVFRRRASALGMAADTPYRYVVRTGDPQFDEQLITTQPVVPELPVSPAPVLHAAPVVQIPWLDDTVRTQLCTAPMLGELAVANTEVSVSLREYDGGPFTQAIELALRLARWPGPAGHAYR